MKKKIIVTIFFMLLAGVLSGCSGSKTTETEMETVNKGRYVEQEIELPEGEAVIGLVQNQDKQLELFTNADQDEKPEYKKYTLKSDGKWEAKNITWLSIIKEKYLNNSGFDGSIEEIVLGQDGVYYALIRAYSSNESRNFIFCSSDGEKECKEVEIPYLEESETDKSGYILRTWISDMNVLSNGTMLLNDVDEGCFLMFSKKGENLGKLKIEGRNIAMDAGNNAFVEKNEITGIKTGSKEILVIDGETKAEKNTVKLDQEESGSCVCKLSNGTLLLADKRGIHRLNEGGTLWETVVDGELNTMNMPDTYIQAFFAKEGDIESYYILYGNGDGGSSLLHYDFDEKIVSVPEEELTVYSLQENATIRQAVSLFQRKHQDVKVNYVVAMQEDETNSKEFIKALNTELIAGNGADVLVLDGLPADSYKKQGVLKDISNLCEDAGILSNVLEAYQVEGSIYEIPTKITIPLILGKKEAVESAHSLSSIIAYEKENEGQSFVKDAYYKQVAREFLKMEYSSFVTNDMFDTNAFENYLENLSYLKENGSVTLDETRNYGFDSNPYFLKKEEANATWKNIINMDSLFVSEALCKEGDYELGAIENSFYGIGRIGINQATKKEKLAEEFLSFVLSDKVQKVNVYDGLPVSKQSWDTLVKTDKEDAYYGVTYVLEDGSYGTLDGAYPTRETREQFASIANMVSNPIKEENSVVDMIMKELDGYLEGSKDISQTIPSIESKVNTYLAEQKTK